MPVDTAPRQVRIAQEGEMWLKPGGRAMRFAATQSFATERVAFCWRARFPIAGPIALSVIDEYADEDGQLAVRLLGVPLQRQRGPETVAGEALRYLAELPLAPPAIVHNRGLEWRQLDEITAEVATTVLDERLAVTVEVDGEGDIVHTTSEMRRFKLRREWVPAPWGGRSATTRRSVPGAFRRQARPTGSCRKVATSTGAPELSQLQASISRSETAAHGES